MLSINRPASAVLQKQTAEAERRARDWAQREVDLSHAHAQNKDSAAALKSQMSVLQVGATKRKACCEV